METDVKSTEVKITYATMSGDQLETLHAALDEAIASAKGELGRTYPLYIDGKPVEAGKTFDDTSPIDTRWIVGHFQSGGREHVRNAIAAARKAYPAWSGMPWQERVASVRRIADAIRRHRWELSALMGYEAGKNRLECVGDVEESADLIAYYCDQVEAHNGFMQAMGALGPGERNASVMRSYGVWAVISPFNFPLALAAVPVALEIGKATRSRRVGSSSDWMSISSTVRRSMACMASSSKSMHIAVQSLVWRQPRTSHRPLSSSRHTYVQ